MTERWLRMSVAEFRALGSGAGRGKAGSEPIRREGRRPKYGNTPAWVGDECFDSCHEASVFIALTQAKCAARVDERVVDIRRSVRFELVPKQDGERACCYVADFVVDYACGRTEVIDAKSEITRRNRVYVLKRKLMLERKGIRIREL